MRVSCAFRGCGWSAQITDELANQPTSALSDALEAEYVQHLRDAHVTVVHTTGAVLDG